MKLTPEIMNESFDIIEYPYPLRNELRFKPRNIPTVKYRIETAAFVSSRIWSYMTSELKESTSLNEFRWKIKAWKPGNCPCKICKIYLQRISYLQVTNQYLLIDHRYCYTFFFICFSACLLCQVFFFVFIFSFAFFLLVLLTTRFKVDLNQPHILDKSYICSICSLIYFLFICIFH